MRPNEPLLSQLADAYLGCSPRDFPVLDQMRQQLSDAYQGDGWAPLSATDRALLIEFLALDAADA
jgi:hypothetical protein